MPVVAYSELDPAGSNIAKQLEGMRGNHKLELISISSSLLDCEKEVSKIKTDLIIFLSKHRSEKGVPTFTAHMPGNWTIAEMGGKAGELCITDPFAFKAISIELNETAKLRKIPFGFTLETDHHGPLIDVPCLFVELGSSEKEWNNEKAAAVVAESVLNGIDKMKKIKPDRIALGVGGGHYCPAFTKLQLDNNVAFTHLLPKYDVTYLTFETFEQGIKRSTKKADVVFIDWKGLKKEQREKIIEFCKRAEVEWEKI